MICSADVGTACPKEPGEQFISLKLTKPPGAAYAKITSCKWFKSSGEKFLGNVNYERKSSDRGKHRSETELCKSGSIPAFFFEEVIQHFTVKP